MRDKKYFAAKELRNDCHIRVNLMKECALNKVLECNYIVKLDEVVQFV